MLIVILVNFLNQIHFCMIQVICIDCLSVDISSIDCILVALLIMIKSHLVSTRLFQHLSFSFSHPLLPPFLQVFNVVIIDVIVMIIVTRNTCVTDVQSLRGDTPTCYKGQFRVHILLLPRK